MDDNADDNRSVQKDPSDAGDVDRLVVFLKSIDEPETSRRQVCTPGRE